MPTVERGVWPSVLLLDGDRRRQAVDVIDLRLLHLADELPGVRAEALDVPPLALGVDRVHRQRALARAARAAADGHLVAGNLDVDALEVVLPGAADRDVRGLAATAVRACAALRGLPLALAVRAIRAAARSARPVYDSRMPATSSGVPHGDDAARRRRRPRARGR